MSKYSYFYFAGWIVLPPFNRGKKQRLGGYRTFIIPGFRRLLAAELEFKYKLIYLSLLIANQQKVTSVVFKMCSHMQGLALCPQLTLQSQQLSCLRKTSASTLALCLPPLVTSPGVRLLPQPCAHHTWVACHPPRQGKSCWSVQPPTGTVLFTNAQPTQGLSVPFQPTQVLSLRAIHSLFSVQLPLEAFHNVLQYKNHPSGFLSSHPLPDMLLVCWWHSCLFRFHAFMRNVLWLSPCRHSSLAHKNGSANPRWMNE